MASNIEYKRNRSLIKQALEEPVGALSEVLLIISIRLLIDIVYEQIISVVFNYAGFQNNRNIFNAILSWVLFFISLPVLHYLSSNRKDRGSAIVFQMLYYLSFLPFTTCVKYGLFYDEYIIFAIVFWIIMFLVEIVNLKSAITAFPAIKLWKKEINDYVIKIIAVVSCLVTIILCYKYTGLRIHINLLTVYDIREEAESYNISPIMGYLFAWTRAINPFMLAYSYLKGKMNYAFLFALCCLLNFGFDGSKTALFLPIVFLAVTMLYKHFSLNIKKLIMFTFLFVGIFSICEYMFNGTYYLSSYLIRRTMFVENLNSSYYYDFFTKNVPDYFRMSFLRRFGFKTPYPGLAKTIGMIYSNREVNANCGLIADAVTNFGVFGVVAYPLLLFFLMRVFDKLSCSANRSSTICVGIYIGLHLVNSALMTSLLTHGILVLLLLMYCATYREKHD